MDKAHRHEQKSGPRPLRDAARTGALLREVQALLESASVGIIVVREGAFVRTNRRAEALFGYGPGELIGLASAVIHPDQDAALALETRADPVIARGEVFAAELELARRDGSRFCALIRGQTLAPGQPSEGIIWVIEDLTERKRAAAQVQASLAFQREMLDAIPTPVFFKDLQGRYQGVNRAFTEFFGRTEDELIGKTVHDCWPRDSADRFFAEDQALLQDPGLQIYEVQVSNARGEPRDLVFHKATLHDPDGQLRGLIGFILDLTERKTAETALRESEERLQLVLEGANDGFWDWNVVTGALLFSPRWEQMLGYGPNELAPHIRIWRKLMHPDDHARARTALLAHFAGATPRYQIEHRMLTKSGEWHWFLHRGKVTARDDAGRPLRMAGTLTDITERRRMEEALRLSLAEVQRHNARMITQNHMSELLLSCATRAEAYAIIARSAARLFLGCSGALAVWDEDAGSDLRVVATWGDPGALPPTFPPDHCRALQHAEIQDAADAAQGTPCLHLPDPPPPAHLCVPLTVRGDRIGLLHINARTALDKAGRADLRSLAITFSEAAKLALSNIRLQETLREQAIRDPLTGLFNRRYLDETLPRELRLAHRRGEPLAAAMLDLDHFKRFNDAYGHEAGDAVLRAIGELLIASLRAGDIACRYGGEELTLILPDCPLNTAQARLDCLRTAIRETRVLYRGGDLPAITVSIGVTVAGGQETDAAAVLTRADAALYRAKASGRNRVIAAAP